MLNISPQRLIDIWHELELCWDGKNGFGTDTAEIYVYRLYDHRPALNGHGNFKEEAERECGSQAAQNLYYVVKMFKEKRACEVAIDGVPWGEWLLSGVLYYRCHVQVKKQ